MQRGGDKLFRKMGLQTPYFDSGGGQEGRLAIRGLRALEPPASKMGSVTMTGPLSRALRQRNIVNDDFVCIVTMTLLTCQHTSLLSEKSRRQPR